MKLFRIPSDSWYLMSGSGFKCWAMVEVSNGLFPGRPGYTEALFIQPLEQSMYACMSQRLNPRISSSLVMLMLSGFLVSQSEFLLIIILTGLPWFNWIFHFPLVFSIRGKLSSLSIVWFIFLAGLSWVCFLASYNILVLLEHDGSLSTIPLCLDILSVLSVGGPTWAT